MPSRAESVCDFNAQLAKYYNASQICKTPQYGIAGGCPYVGNLGIGVCSDAIQHVQRLSPADRVASISCWPTADNAAVAAIRFGYARYDNVSTLQTLGSQAVVNQASPVSLDTSASAVQRVQMWYSNVVDAAKRAQLGRLRITATSGSVMDCGDTSLDLNAADLDNVVDPAGADGGLGSVLVGAVAISSVNGAAAISVNGLALLVLRKPPTGTLSTAVLNLSTAGDCLDVGLSITSNMGSCLDSSSCNTMNTYVCTTQGNNHSTSPRLPLTTPTPTHAAPAVHQQPADTLFIEYKIWL